MSISISKIGEKGIIRDFITPLFNPDLDFRGVGDDCALIEAEEGYSFLFSTDRVPADLIAFRLGILDYFDLGRYLAWLNISDIAACGGDPIALLLNFGLPQNLEYNYLKELCRGVLDAANDFNCKVLGGDLSSCNELSISATSIGKVRAGKALLRNGAKSGDLIFISKPIGYTPAAFAYYLRSTDDNPINLTKSEIDRLNKQFKAVYPLVNFGLYLSSSGKCSSCMDNTDGLGNSLEELALASHKSFIVQKEKVYLENLVVKIAEHFGEDPFELALGAGADFSLVGTINPNTIEKKLVNQENNFKIIGYVENGSGVFQEENGSRSKINYSKWDYFTKIEE